MNYQELKEYHIFEAKLHDLPRKWIAISLDLDWFLINSPITKGSYFADIEISLYSATIDLHVTNPTAMLHKYIKLLDFNEII